MSTPSALEDKLFRWKLRYNLNYIVHFHNQMQALLREKLDALPPDLPDSHVDKVTIHLYDTMNSANALLLAFGFLEEMLIDVWRRQFPREAIPAGSSIERYKPLLKALHVDLGSSECWGVVRDAAKVRKCILHANGHIGLMRDPDEIRSCIGRYHPALEDRNGAVVVTSIFLQRCVVAIRQLREEMLKGLPSRPADGEEP